MYLYLMRAALRYAQVAPFTVDRWLADGEAVALGDGRALHARWTPGHTPDGLSLWLPDERRVFTGDLCSQPPQLTPVRHHRRREEQCIPHFTVPASKIAEINKTIMHFCCQ